MPFPFEDGFLITDELTLTLEDLSGQGLIEKSSERITVDAGTATIISVGEQGPAGAAGSSGSYEDEVPYAKRVDFVSDALLYRGEAVVGSAEGSPAWRIRKVELLPDGDVIETWANGSASFNQVWTNRASLSYS